nr:hypothetical protein [Streptomyces sp. 846.5]
MPWRGAIGLHRSLLREGPEIKGLAEEPGLTAPVLAVGAGGRSFTAATMTQAVAAKQVGSVSLPGVGRYAGMQSPDKSAKAIPEFVRRS